MGTYDSESFDPRVNQYTIYRALSLIIYITHAKGYGYRLNASMVHIWGSMAWWLLHYPHTTLEALENVYYDTLVWMDNNVTDTPSGKHS